MTDCHRRPERRVTGFQSFADVNHEFIQSLYARDL